MLDTIPGSTLVVYKTEILSITFHRIDRAYGFFYILYHATNFTEQFSKAIHRVLRSRLNMFDFDFCFFVKR